MDRKYHYLVIGILAGLILSAFLILIFDPSLSLFSRENQTLSVPSPSLSSPEPALESNEGKINLNNCSAQDLESLPGIGPAKAEAIINFRSKYGGFQTLDELLYVPGIGHSLFIKISDELYIGD
jgi:comEA protein